MSLIFFLAKTKIFKGELDTSVILGEELPLLCFMFVDMLGRLGELGSIGLSETDLLR